MNRSSDRARSRRVEVDGLVGSELWKNRIEMVKMLMVRISRSFINLKILLISLLRVIRMRIISNIMLIQEKEMREID